MAMTNMLATIPGILVPTLVGVMTHGTDGLAPWHTGKFVIFLAPWHTGKFFIFLAFLAHW